MKIKWQPQEKQIEALKRKEKEILFGGSRGGGKTDCGMAWLMYNIQNPKFRALVIRRNADDLSDWTDRARSFYDGVNAEVTGKPSIITFPSGAIIRTGHLKDENAYSKYQGHEYQNILIEELTHIPREDDFEKLMGSCRSTIDIKPQVFCTTNPDGPGHKWVKERWNIPDKPTETVHSKERVFIPSRVEDNKYLVEKDPGYIEYLDNIKDTELREAWKDGSWEGINVKGAYYRNQIQQMRQTGHITRVPYDDNLRVTTWWDLGMNDETVIGFFQKYGMEWRLFDCYCNSGEGLKHYIDYLREKGYRYEKHYAPHDIVVRELGTGKSRLESARELGINFETIHDRTGKEKSAVPNLPITDGINEVRNQLPSLYIDEGCSDLIDALTQYRKDYNEKLNTFRDKPLHDWTSHYADMMRYWAITPKQVSQARVPLKQINNIYK